MSPKRIFHQKQYRNPFFAKRTNANVSTATVFKLPKLFYIIVGALLLVGLNYSQVFQIKNVTVLGNQQINAPEIKALILDQTKQRRFLLFHQGSIFFFNKAQAAQAIQQHFLVDSVRVYKRYFQTIQVLLNPQPNGIAWMSGGVYYFLDTHGQVLRQAESGTQTDISASTGTTDVVRSVVSTEGFPVVSDLSNTTVTVHQTITSPDLVAFVLIVFNSLSSTSDIIITQFIVDRPYSQDLIMKTQEGWEARFKITDDPKVQTGTLLSVLRQKIKDRKNLDYIDLRYGERVFYQ